MTNISHWEPDWLVKIPSKRATWVGGAGSNRVQRFEPGWVRMPSAGYPPLILILYELESVTSREWILLSLAKTYIYLLFLK